MATQSLQPLAACIKISDDGKPSLEGYQCSRCGEVLLEHRRGCPNCAAVGTLDVIPLALTGTLFTYTIVHRSFPGIATPFISAIVKLDGGGFIKGNLVDIDATAEKVHFNMPVRVKFDQVAGNPPLLRHVFVPVSSTPEAT